VACWQPTQAVPLGRKPQFVPACGLTIAAMQRYGVGRSTARAGTAFLLAAAALTLSVISAQAASDLTNHKISGYDTAISCMTASRCVAVGSSDGRGFVVALDNGKQTHTTSVAAEYLDSVSCPSAAGCWAVGLGLDDSGLVLVKLGPTGKAAKPIKETAPYANLLSWISCESITSCELAGTDVLASPSVPEIATWSGKKLSIHRLAPPKGSTSSDIQGVSCWRTTCYVVGSYTYGADELAGIVLTVTNGKPGKVHTIAGDGLIGVSCVSASKCYATGHAESAEGILLTVTNGVPAHVHSESADMYGIECAGVTCHSSGTGSSGAVIVTLRNGTPTGAPVADSAIDGFSGSDSIAQRATGFAAVGPATTSAGSDVAIG